jgi:hypothetical protein
MILWFSPQTPQSVPTIFSYPSYDSTLLACHRNLRKSDVVFRLIHRNLCNSYLTNFSHGESFTKITFLIVISWIRFSLLLLHRFYSIQFRNTRVRISIVKKMVCHVNLVFFAVFFVTFISQSFAFTDPLDGNPFIFSWKFNWKIDYCVN